MPRIARQQLELLTAAIRHNDYLARIVDEIEHLHRVVFYANARANWGLVHASAEQILMAEIASRHGGQYGNIHHALRRMERAGQPWDAALRELAAQIHSYYTTPLGIVIRQDLFGDEVVFFTPDAYEWTDQIRGQEEAGQPAEP